MRIYINVFRNGTVFIPAVAKVSNSSSVLGLSLHLILDFLITLPQTEYVP